MLHQNISRFAFDRVFTASDAGLRAAANDPGAEVAALRQELRRLEAERDAALAAARAEAFADGLAEARRERETALLTAIDAMHGAVEALDERFGETERRLTGEATDVALAAAELIAGRAIAAAPAGPIDEAIGRVLGQVARGTEIAIRVHSSLVPDIEACVARRQAGDRRRLNLVVMADDTLAPGDALLGWEQGGLALDATARRAAVHAELETLLP